VFWDIRRTDQLLESLKCQDKLHFQNSQELIDQILLAYQGKIKISNLPMLLRDETNLEYVFTEDRQDTFQLDYVAAGSPCLELCGKLGDDGMR
jgi:hypothetical protein